MHFLFLGASGFGKTFNILKLVFDAAYNKFPTCVLDAKADSKFEGYLRRISQLFNIEFKV
jgi:hypothetical protein